MSEAAPIPVSVTSQVADVDNTESTDMSSRGEFLHGGHEANDIGQTEPPIDVASTTESVAGDEGTALEAEGGKVLIDASQGPAPEPQPHTSEANVKSGVTQTKPSMSIKTPTGKMNGGPPTPLVKKILNSGTFGAGAAKTTKPTPANLSSVKPVSAAPALKKTISGSSAASTKPATAPSRTPAPAAAVPSRRLSVVPTKTPAPPLVKPSLSGSTNKPAPSSTAPRASVVSPTGSVASSASRPRASVSEGVKRATPTPRQSLAGGTKPSTPTSKPPPPARSATSAPPKSSRTTPSISSIREVKEDEKVLEELHSKLKDATETLASKTEAVAALEGQVEALTSSLESALADAESQQSASEGFGKEKSLLEKQLSDASDALQKLESEHRDAASALDAARLELESAKSNATAQNELVEKLQAQIQTLKADAESSKDALENLKAITSSEISAAAVAESGALSSARSENTNLTNALEVLKAAHAKTLQEVDSQLEILQVKTALVNDLNDQLTHLKQEKDNNSGKLSELEVEILELKESQELLEEEHERSLANIKALESQLSKASTAAQQADEDFKKKEADYATQIATIETGHKEALEAASKMQADISSKIEALRSELADTQTAKEAAEAAVQAAVEQHARKLEEVETSYIQKQSEISEEIKRITTELESQEEYYNAKVNVVKNEHAELLQEAFERAKKEASQEHAQELQTLRTTSSATIEQITSMNQSALENLKAEHASALEAEVKGLEKQINSLKLELKATSDDLAKAKASLEAARAEVQSLTTQRDEARADSAPRTSPEHLEEVARLKQDLSIRRDDLEAATEALDLTKASLTEMSNQHTKALEEAAQARAEEATKLRAVHDEAIALLTAEKAALANNLSDVEGELATLKATVNAEAVTPKSNGNGAAHPPSPGVTKEELQRLHEAHNLKIYDIQAEHEKMIKGLREELEASKTQAGQLEQEIGRKAMEIQYLEQDQEENQEHITRLKEDVESLTEQLSKATTGSA